MKKKALIIASCGVLSLSAIVLANAFSGSVKLTKADDAHSTHDADSMKYIGFDWSDPTLDGYKPYYRCPSCCSIDPASSRYSSKTDTTPISIEDLKLSALSSIDKSSISGDAITSADTDTYANLDQVGKDNDGNRLVSNNYVKDGEKEAIYFSRSRAIFDTQSSSSDESVCSFSFNSNLEEGKSLGSLSFSYRYLNYSSTKKSDSSDTSTAYSSKLVFAYGDTSKTCVLDSRLNSDGEWHALSLTTQEAIGEESISDFSKLAFKFSDLQGCILISNLYYSEETKTEMEKRLGATAVFSEDKTSLTFGLYPQTHVSDTATIASLNKMSETEKLNGYYFLNGNYYEKKAATPYRDSSKFTDGTVIVKNTTYWYSCEAIKWGVISTGEVEVGTKYTLRSELLLDVHRYDDDSNDYHSSEIREWLNGDFRSSAFDLVLDKSSITTTLIYDTAEESGASVNSYASGNGWMDTVYLQSAKDMQTDGDPTVPSDWTKAAGNDFLDVGYHWTRSPSPNGANLARCANYYKKIEKATVSQTDNAVRPCVSILIYA